MINRLVHLHRKVATQGAKGLSEWLLFFGLVPFSLLYGSLMGLRAVAYSLRLLPSCKASVPVVSVGNLAAGGTGKTPVVDWLVKEFSRLGQRPVVISRGYGGAFQGTVGVVSRGNGLELGAEEAGDEPYLLARRNPGTPVLIARRRKDAVKFAEKHLQADLILLDDGFQHRAVQRDLDLVLLDANHPCANGWPLPAGLLREFPLALKRADLLLLTRAKKGAEFSFAEKPVFCSRHQLAEEAVSLAGDKVKLADLRGLKLFAFAGIADPEGFFSSLREIGLQVEGYLGLADHCRYDKQLLGEIVQAGQEFDAFITTEKDAVKLADDNFPVPCYQVPMSIVLEDEAAFRVALKKKIWSE